MSERSDDTRRMTRRERDAEPVLPGITRDEREIGWGDEPVERDLEWYRNERPPHHV